MSALLCPITLPTLLPYLGLPTYICCVYPRLQPPSWLIWPVHTRSSVQIYHKPVYSTLIGTLKLTLVFSSDPHVWLSTRYSLCLCSASTLTLTLTYPSAWLYLLQLYVSISYQGLRSTSCTIYAVELPLFSSPWDLSTGLISQIYYASVSMCTAPVQHL